jgi:hypothetical protein
LSPSGVSGNDGEYAAARVIERRLELLAQIDAHRDLSTHLAHEDVVE